MDSTDRRYTSANFKPAPGYLLLESVEDTNTFKPTKDPHDEGLTSDIRLGKVLAVGESYTNDFNHTFKIDAQEGEILVYNHKYDQGRLEIDFKRYPIIHAEQIRGRMEWLPLKARLNSVRRW